MPPSLPPACCSLPQEGAHPGKTMRVVEGRHSGLLCEVVALEPREEGRSGGGPGGLN